MILVYILFIVIYVKVYLIFGREMVYLFFLFLNILNNFNSSIEMINIMIKICYFEVRIFIVFLIVEVLIL